MKTNQQVRGPQSGGTTTQSSNAIKQGKKEPGISNSGGQRSDQTSNADTDKTEKKKMSADQDKHDIGAISDRHLRESDSDNVPDLPAEGGKADASK